MSGFVIISLYLNSLHIANIAHINSLTIIFRLFSFYLNAKQCLNCLTTGWAEPKYRVLCLKYQFGSSTSYIFPAKQYYFTAQSNDYNKFMLLVVGCCYYFVQMCATIQHFVIVKPDDNCSQSIFSNLLFFSFCASNAFISIPCVFSMLTFLLSNRFFCEQIMLLALLDLKYRQFVCRPKSLCQKYFEIKKKKKPKQQWFLRHMKSEKKIITEKNKYGQNCLVRRHTQLQLSSKVCFQELNLFICQFNNSMTRNGLLSLQLYTIYRLQVISNLVKSNKKLGTWRTHTHTHKTPSIEPRRHFSVWSIRQRCVSLSFDAHFISGLSLFSMQINIEQTNSLSKFLSPSVRIWSKRNWTKWIAMSCASLFFRIISIGKYSSDYPLVDHIYPM